MDAESFITPYQRAELAIKQTSAEVPPEPIPVWQLEQQLSPEEVAKRQDLVLNSHRRLDAIMTTWEYPWYNDVRTPHHLGDELARRDFGGDKRRTVYGTDWMPIDIDAASKATIQLQVRRYFWKEDQAYELYKERVTPHLGLWVRLLDPSGVSSEATEVFDFPGLVGAGKRGTSSHSRDVRMKGVSLLPDSPYWEKLSELLSDLEDHMGLAPQPRPYDEQPTTV